MASLLICFFSSLILSKPTYYLLQLCVKGEQNRKNCWIFGNFVYKLLKLYYDVTRRFSSILKETGQIKAKQQNMELELAIAYPRSSGVARNFEKREGA